MALRRLLDGTEAGTAQSVSELFRVPLLRLPGDCQPRAPQGGGEEFAGERSVQQQRLLEALLSPETTLSPSEREAFGDRLAEDAILPAAELLERLRHTGALTPAEIADAEQDLKEHRIRGRRGIENQIETLRLELAALYNLDLRTGDSLREALEQLDNFAEAVTEGSLIGAPEDDSKITIPAESGERRSGIPADFPQMRASLKQIQALRDRVRAEIAGDQRERLNQIAKDRPFMAAEIGELVSTLDCRDPTTVEDIIASLQAGHSVSRQGDELVDSFGQFFPDFVERLATNSEEFNRGRIDKALHEGGSLGPLDFSRLDTDGRLGAKQVLESWRQAEHALQPTERDFRDPVRRIIEALGFAEVSVHGDTILIPGKLMVMRLRCAPPEVDGWFLPPDFGSIAEGNYRLFLCHPQVPDDQIVSELAKFSVDVPCLLFMFGRLSRLRRQDFAQRMRARRQRVLLIDEIQILFLASLEVSRLETLFACATPFGYVQPYTTDPGNIPREMFFGRKEEIVRIHARSADGCLVYGGRQLGKSALLNHVRKIYHRPKDGVLVFYRSCDVIGGPIDPPKFIWQVIARELASLGVLKGNPLDGEAVASAVKTWLDANPTQQILMLLDETDQFMSAEARTSFPNLTRLKDLMVDTAWRFKAVFAGLHNVRRAWKAPNTPLAHLGEPICVGPLNTTPENRAEARRLVVEPMRAAGFEYEQPGLGWDILARVNHYPSLVQVFCKGLLTELYRKAQPVGRGPRWRIGRAQMFEGVSYRQISDAIRGKFRLTLDLDPRFDLIAHVLALYRFDRGDETVLRIGLPVVALYQEVIGYWPDNLPRLDVEAFGAFLDEMVDLGVLSQFGPKGDRYGLRTAQVAQMLGGRAEVETQIERIMSIEPRVDYDGALYFRRVVPDDPSGRAPLSDRQLEALFEPSRTGPRIVVASSSLWGANIARDLASLAEGWGGQGAPREGVVSAGTTAEFRKAFPRLARHASRKVIVVPHETSWTADWVVWSAKQNEVGTGRVLPIFLAEPSRLRDFRLSDLGEANDLVFLPQPWGDQMLRAFLLETDSAIFDHGARRAKLIAGTGGAPVLLRAALSELVTACRVDGRDPDVALADWCNRQTLKPADVGLSSDLVPLIRVLDNVELENLGLLFDLLREAWVGPNFCT